MTDEKVLTRVRALLAKAESTTFPEEAEALTAKAQELITRHRIDVLAAHVSGDGPGSRRIRLDRPYVTPKAALAGAVARANGCRAVHLVDVEEVQLVGYPDDLEAVELLFTSLLVQAARAMWQAGPQGRRTRSFRHAFLTAFAWRIGDRLEAAAADTTAIAASSDLLPVLARRDDEVEAALVEQFPHLGTRRMSVRNAAGWSAGVAAADTADIGGRKVLG